MKSKTILALASLLFCCYSQAQPMGWGQWLELKSRDGVTVSYRLKIERDELRVQWKCSSQTGKRKACSVGAGSNKTYLCTRGSNGNVVGQTSSLGERGTVLPFKEHMFPDESACHGLNADYMKAPLVEISIEDE
jgi:hypothetical protein